MEQKKTLWILAAVGAFLLVVLGTACIFYSPAKKPVPTIASVSPVEKKTTNTGWSAPAVEPKNSESTQLIALPNEVEVNTKANDVVVLADNATTIDLNSLKRDIITETTSAAQTQPQNINITVNIPETKETNYISAPIVDNTNESTKSVAVKKAEPAKTETAKETSPVTTKTVTSKAVVKATENTTVSTTVNKTEIKKTQFWVQVAAYSNKKGAEGARSVLDANKIPADIFTYKDNKDNLFYRVRVGPYTTKSEAEYWRSRIIKINEFSKAESFVTSTTN